MRRWLRLLSLAVVFVTFDPATLTLSGWWRGSFGGLPWTDTASAGTSGGQTLVSSGSDPTVGAVQNGFTPATFDGVSQRATSNTLLLSSLFSAGAGTLIILAKTTVAAADDAAAVGNNPGLCRGFDGATQHIGISFSDAGGRFGLFDGTTQCQLSIAASNTAYHSFLLQWDGANLYGRVDAGTLASTPCNGLGNLTTALEIGFSATTFFTGSEMEILTSATVLSLTTCNNIGSYFQARYALAMGFPAADTGIQTGFSFRGVAARGPVRRFPSTYQPQKVIPAPPGDPFLAVSSIQQPRAVQSIGLVGPVRDFRANPLGYAVNPPVPGAPFLAQGVQPSNAQRPTGRGNAGPVRSFPPTLLAQTVNPPIPGDPFLALGIQPANDRRPSTRGGPAPQFPPTLLAQTVIPAPQGDPFLALGSVPSQLVRSPAAVGPVRQFTPTLAYFNPAGILFGDLAGTSTITFGQSGVISAQADVAGSAALTFGQSATIGGKAAIAGTSSITFGQSATISAKAALGGTAAILFGQNASIAARADLRGTAGFVFGATGSISDLGAADIVARDAASVWMLPRYSSTVSQGAHDSAGIWTLPRRSDVVVRFVNDSTEIEKLPSTGETVRGTS